MVNAASGQVSIRWGLCGPRHGDRDRCASAANAIAMLKINPVGPGATS